LYAGTRLATKTLNEFSREAIRQSGYLRDGFADFYDANRPRPPRVLLDALTRYTGGPPLGLVVDLGSGTGLSARAWAARAVDVVGVEPNPSMLSVAEAQTSDTNVRYVEAFADATGLGDVTADLVTCSQSFHWMDRRQVLAEAARILRPGGVFAAYDYDMPPLVHPKIDAAFREHLELRHRFRDMQKVEAGWTRMSKPEHLDAIRGSGHFTYAREAVFHDEAEVEADRIAGLARSLGLVPELIALGVTEEELGLTRLVETTRRIVGEGRVPWVLGYRVRLGVK
jgi:ubiquinone/menaquinone biosynthesis C-methylase UbiE